MTDHIFDIIGRARLVPVIEIDDPDAAPDLGAALIAGGLPCAEITLRTARAIEAIQRLRASSASLLVGAGTVLTPDQVDGAIDAGASFLVAPGFNPTTVARAHERGIPIIPGVSTPSEVEGAMALGLTVLKFFPAAIAGGPAFLRAVAGVYPTVRFIPTGGITPENLGSYLTQPNVLACGGSWMVGRDVLAAGDFAQVTVLVREAMEHATASAGSGSR